MKDFRVAVWNHGMFDYAREFDGLGEAITYVEKELLHSPLYFSWFKLEESAMAIQYEHTYITITHG